MRCGVQHRMESVSLDGMVNMLVHAAMFGTAQDVDSVLRKWGLFPANLCMVPLGLNALHIAVQRNDVDMVDVLLRAGMPQRVVCVHHRPHSFTQTHMHRMRVRRGVWRCDLFR
jgi:hypothetical protein